jgi:hypothetical protein
MTITMTSVKTEEWDATPLPQEEIYDLYVQEMAFMEA